VQFSIDDDLKNNAYKEGYDDTGDRRILAQKRKRKGNHDKKRNNKNKNKKEEEEDKKKKKKQKKKQKKNGNKQIRNNRKKKEKNNNNNDEKKKKSNNTSKKQRGSEEAKRENEKKRQAKEKVAGYRRPLWIQVSSLRQIVQFQTLRLSTTTLALVVVVGISHQSTFQILPFFLGTYSGEFTLCSTQTDRQ